MKIGQWGTRPQTLWHLLQSLRSLNIFPNLRLHTCTTLVLLPKLALPTGMPFVTSPIVSRACRADQEADKSVSRPFTGQRFASSPSRLLLPPQRGKRLPRHASPRILTDSEPTTCRKASILPIKPSKPFCDFRPPSRKPVQIVSKPSKTFLPSNTIEAYWIQRRVVLVTKFRGRKPGSSVAPARLVKDKLGA